MTRGYQKHGILRLPTQVYFGEGAVKSLPGVVAEFGDRLFICCDPNLIGTVPFERLLGQLKSAGIECYLWTAVEPELPINCVEASAASALSFEPYAVLGYGGGSALDLAKLVALRVCHRGDISQYYGENAVPSAVLPVIAVPTTAGTGSEVTPVAVVTDPDRDQKVGVSSPYLVPRYAVVDPDLTRGAPAAVIAHAGVDALVHAIEAFTSAVRAPAWTEPLPVFVGSNQFSRFLARDAFMAIAPNLVRAVREPEDAAARGAMSYGSLLAGVAFGSAGTHLSHAIQYPVGALTKTPHGLGTGLLLPHVLWEFRSEIEADLACLGALLGFVGSPAERSDQVIFMTQCIGVEIGLPRSLAEIGISEEQIGVVADKAGRITRLSRNINAHVSIERITKVVEAAWRGDRLEEAT